MELKKCGVKKLKCLSSKSVLYANDIYWATQLIQITSIENIKRFLASGDIFDTKVPF